MRRVRNFFRGLWKDLTWGGANDRRTEPERGLQRQASKGREVHAKYEKQRRQKGQREVA